MKTYLLHATFATFAISVCAGPAYALPPLGLMRIDPATEFGARLLIDNDTAYLSATFRRPVGGVWALTQEGDLSAIEISHPDFDDTGVRLTRVVRGPDDGFYVGGTFTDERRAALFQLDDPTAPLVTWFGNVLGLDDSLRGIGNNALMPLEFHLDGSIVELNRPEDPIFGGPIDAEVRDVSASG